MIGYGYGNQSQRDRLRVLDITSSPEILVFSALKSGSRAGGLVTGLDVANDDTLVARDDIFNMFVRGPAATTWSLIYRPGDNITATKHHDVGNWDICIAPSNSSRIYAFMNGECYRTTNGGATLTLMTGFVRDTWLDHRNSYRAYGARARVKPDDPNTVICMKSGGLWYSTDGAVTWTRNTTVPAPAVGKPWACVAFNPANPLEVAVMVTDSGIYRSTTGVAGTFSQIGSQPANAGTFTDVVYGPDGVLHCIGDATNGQYRRWTSGGGWVSPSGATGTRVAVNPNDGSKVYIYTEAGGPAHVSLDGGITFAIWASDGSDNVTRAYTSIPWLTWTEHASMTIGDAVHLHNRTMLVHGDGIGAWETAPDNNQPFILTMTEISEGIDQLITQDITVTPSGNVHVTHQDRTVFSYTRANVKTPATRHGISQSIPLAHGNSVDFAADDDNYLVVPWNPQVSAPGWPANKWLAISTNGGLNWSAPTTYPTGVYAGGCAAVGEVGNIVWIVENGPDSYYTKDGGATWTALRFGGLSVTGATGQVGFFSDEDGRRRPILNDKNNPDIFYIHIAEVPDRGINGIWKFNIASETLTRKSNVAIPAYQAALTGKSSKLRMPLGKSPHLFWTYGQQNSWGDLPSPDMFLFSPDEGVHWGLMPELAEVDDFAFGAAATGMTYPAIYAAGYSDENDPLSYAVFAMFDFGFSQAGDGTVTTTGTWQQISKWPLGWDVQFTCMAADPILFGRVYMGSAVGQFVLDVS